MAEKRYNTSHVCKVFHNFAEAQHYQVKYKGKLFSLQQSQHIQDIEGDMSTCLPNYQPLEGEDGMTVHVSDGPKIHVLVVEKKEEIS